MGFPHQRSELSVRIMNMGTNVSKPSLLKTSFAASIFFFTGGMAMAQSTVTLTAAPTTTTLPDGQIVQMWGYTCGDVLTPQAASVNATCTAMNAPSAQS